MKAEENAFQDRYPDKEDLEKVGKEFPNFKDMANNEIISTKFKTTRLK